MADLTPVQLGPQDRQSDNSICSGEQFLSASEQIKQPVLGNTINTPSKRLPRSPDFVHCE